MADKLQNYEMVSIYQLEPEDQDHLLGTQKECVFNWCTRDQWPMGVVMSMLWHDNRVWLTAGGHRHRISAVKRNPQVSVVITSHGTEMGRGKTITIKGRCTIHEDRETKEWFYPKFARHLRDSEEEALVFAEMLDSPLRVVLEIVPEKYITYDGAKMAAHTRGELSDDKLAAPLESDTLRFQNEARRRGLID